MTASVPHQPVRADGIDARQRLLQAGLRLFAKHGFQKTSVRALAQAAQVGIGAVSYYFGDKEGLYRALFIEPPVGSHPDPGGVLTDGAVPLDQAMRGFFTAFLAPLKQADAVRLLMTLHFREMADPTGAWACALDSDIRPLHEALVRRLIAEFGLRRADADVHRLAVAVMALAVHPFAFQDGVNSLAPQVFSGPKGLVGLTERFAGFAVSMIEGERARRAEGGPADTGVRPASRGGR